MSQDNKKSFVMYQGDGSNNVFSVPMTKGKYGTISVAFVRRGLDQYEYNPDTWGLNGGLFAWDLSGTKVYTDTATPAIGATIYDQYGVDAGDTVAAVGGATITVNTNVYTRDTLHDVDENTVLTWTGDALQIGDYIVIERTTTRTQPFEFQNNQKHIEKSDDNLERQIQEVADKVDNALLVDPTHVIDSNKMNPVEWMGTILRSVDKSVRGFRYLNGWLDYSLDDPNIADVDKTWTHLVNTDNIKAIREQSRIENNETIYYTEYLAQDGSWKTLSDPHKWNNMKLSDLADVAFTNLSAGSFIMFDGLKWKNVYSSATASWGTLIGDITDQTDLQNALSAKVNTDGTSIITGPLLMRATQSFKCAIAPYWDGVGFFKLNDNDSVTLMASIEYNSGFEPATTNTYNIGASARKWKNLYLAGKAYMSVINNGYDIAVPVTNSADTLALVSKDINPLQQQINHIQTIGRFLSFWDATTGLALTNPQTSPYVYQTGDYFRVGVVASGGATNYKPTGSSYTTGVASTVVETEPLSVGQVYYYDGTNWALAAGGSVAIDETTIVFNSDNEIQAVATVNQNTAAGATNPVYDWVGTLAEYQAQNIETLHPDWICYITDDVSGGTSVYTKTEVDDNFVGKGHEVIDFQAPTAQNNYTWYRKYADGWVEQGGLNHTISLNSSGYNNMIDLPITMADTNYSALAVLASQYGGRTIGHIPNSSTTTQVCIGGYASSAGSSSINWQVSGMAV